MVSFSPRWPVTTRLARYSTDSTGSPEMSPEIENPYATPKSNVQVDPDDLDYVGFWSRVGASIIDSIILLLITVPVSYWAYGSEYFLGDKFLHGPLDFVLSYVFPFVAIILFWKYKSATPGKMMIHAIIVDANTGKKPSTGQLVGRYFAYILSMLPLFLGFLWVAWDPRKQAWHDKLANTVVVRGSH